MLPNYRDNWVSKREQTHGNNCKAQGPTPGNPLGLPGVEWSLLEGSRILSTLVHTQWEISHIGHREKPWIKVYLVWKWHPT